MRNVIFLESEIFILTFVENNALFNMLGIFTIVFDGCFFCTLILDSAVYSGTFNSNYLQ